jgi:hypothetical protein
LVFLVLPFSVGCNRGLRAVLRVQSLLFCHSVKIVAPHRFDTDGRKYSGRLPEGTFSEQLQSQTMQITSDTKAAVVLSGAQTGLMQIALVTVTVVVITPTRAP